MWQRLLPLFVGLAFVAPASAQQTWYVPDDFPTIQAGIDGASAGDTVILRDGTYFESISIEGKHLTLKSENGPAAAVIDGSLTSGSVIYIAGRSTNDSRIEGITIANGNNAEGGGMYCNMSSPTLLDCIFVNNEAGGGGGLIAIQSSIKLHRCTFTDNSARNGGGGGARFTLGGNPELFDCVFTNNTSDREGGGLNGAFVNGMKLVGCNFSNNSSNEGGGVFLLSFSTITVRISECSFSNNSGFYGGAMWISEVSPEITNCMFSGNQAEGASGTGYGGGMFIKDRSRPSIRYSTFIDNRSGLRGGGVHTESLSGAQIVRCTLSGNVSSDGGAIFSHDGPLVDVNSSIIWDNLSQSGDDLASLSNPIAATYSNISGGWPGVGNIGLDPLFVDAPNSNYSLQATSPCIDTGDPSVGLDPDGSRADMGAIPYDQPQPYLEVSNLVAGQSASIDLEYCRPQQLANIAYSLAGGGPIQTGVGTVLLTPPYVQLQPILVDATGAASLSVSIPTRASGLQVWVQAYDQGSGRLTNGWSGTVQ